MTDHGHEYGKEIVRERSKMLEKYSHTPGQFHFLTVHLPSISHNSDYLEDMIGVIGDLHSPACI
jgi:hypothetical protein